jgi:hypothetical protein
MNDTLRKHNYLPLSLPRIAHPVHINMPEIPSDLEELHPNPADFSLYLFIRTSSP